jgi:hypothetical protein
MICTPKHNFVDLPPCSPQREAARKRREANANFAGVFSSEMPLLPVGWLTVTIDSLKHPPVALDRPGPDQDVSVVVHATGSKKQAFVTSETLGGLGVAEGERSHGQVGLTPTDEIHIGVSLSFEVRTQQLQDRSQQVLVEVHSSTGVYGTVSLPLSRAMRAGAEFDGAYEMMDPDDRARTVRGYRQHGEIAPTSIRLRFYYLASSQKHARSSHPLLFSRGTVIPYNDKDLGVTRTARQQSQAALFKGSSTLQQADPRQWGRWAYGGRESRQFPPRPQSAQPVFREREELSVRGPRNRALPRPQSADPCERPYDDKTFSSHVESGPGGGRPQSPAFLPRRERPQSAAPDARRRPLIIDPIFADKRRLATTSGRPASAGARRAAPISGTNAGAHKTEGRRLVMMPIARAAELHSQSRSDPIRETFIVLEEEIRADDSEAGAAEFFAKGLVHYLTAIAQG